MCTRGSFQGAPVNKSLTCIAASLLPLLQLHYIHSAPGGSGSTNPPVVSTVYGYVGTPPAQRQLSTLVWRLGPSHFLEEVLPATSVAAIYELGPNYVGSFQAVYLPCEWFFLISPASLGDDFYQMLLLRCLFFLTLTLPSVFLPSQVKTPRQRLPLPPRWLWYQKRRCRSASTLSLSLLSPWPRSEKSTTNWIARPSPNRSDTPQRHAGLS